MATGSLEQALARMDRFERRAAQAGIALRATPPQPVGCCGRGCSGCVWEGFYGAVLFWCEDAEQALGACPA